MIHNQLIDSLWVRKQLDNIAYVGGKNLMVVKNLGVQYSSFEHEKCSSKTGAIVKTTKRDRTLIGKVTNKCKKEKPPCNFNCLHRRIDVTILLC